MTDIPDARITRGTMFIGGKELPGLIEKGGITVTPGGAEGVNRVTVVFLVGRVDIEDPWEQP